MRHTRHWAGPYFDPETTTKESLQDSEGVFDWQTISNDVYTLETELALIGGEDARETADWLHAQLFAFEATRLAGNLSEITSMGKNCEPAYDRLVWAFRTDLTVPGDEPPVKPPGLRRVP
jgi:hypothetical protein